MIFPNFPPDNVISYSELVPPAKVLFRYKPVDPNLRKWMIPCQHTVKKTYQCRQIDIDTLKEAKKNFFKDYYKNNQNMRLTSLLEIANPQRDRNRYAETYKPHELQIQYTVSSYKCIKYNEIFIAKICCICNMDIFDKYFSIN